MDTFFEGVLEDWTGDDYQLMTAATAAAASAASSTRVGPPLSATNLARPSRLASSDKSRIGKSSSAKTTPTKTTANKATATKNKPELMFRKPMSIATIVVRGVEFPVHADLLCQHSDYFSRALRGTFAEAQTQRIELDCGDNKDTSGTMEEMENTEEDEDEDETKMDVEKHNRECTSSHNKDDTDDDYGDDDTITAEDFGLWVDLLYRAHFHAPHPFVLRKEETGGTLSTRQILVLWQLSDRFLHAPLAAVAEESLQHRLSLYSPDQWRKLYRTRPASDLRARVGRLQDAFRLCIARGLPFGDAVVAACANCPPQLYAACVDEGILQAEFMARVSRQMILAHADTSLLSKEQRQAGATGDAIRGGAAGDLSKLMLNTMQ